MRPLWFGLALCVPFIDQLRHHFLKKVFLVAGQIILRVGGINGFSDVNMWRAVVWLGLICNLANSAEIRPEYFPGLKQNGVKAVSIRVIRIVVFQEGEGVVLAQTSAHYWYWYRSCLRLIIHFLGREIYFQMGNHFIVPRYEFSAVNETYIDISNGQKFELSIYPSF